jgi:hypothetical protein
MQRFKDNVGFEWEITLDAPKIKQCRQDCGIDLVDSDSTGKAYDHISTDPCALVDTLWCLCRKQAEANKIDQEQFAARITGDTLELAADAMMAAVADFFPKRRAELTRTVAAKAQAIRAAGMEAALKRINDPALEKRLIEGIDQRIGEQLEKLTPSNSAMNTPALSAFRPTG